MNKDDPVDDVQCLQDIGHRWRLNLKQEDNETKLKELADTRDSPSSTWESSLDIAMCIIKNHNLLGNYVCVNAFQGF